MNILLFKDMKLFEEEFMSSNNLIKVCSNLSLVTGFGIKSKVLT